jgi:hypothetical protein
VHWPPYIGVAIKILVINIPVSNNQNKNDRNECNAKQNHFAPVLVLIINWWTPAALQREHIVRVFNGFA